MNSAKVVVTYVNEGGSTVVTTDTILGDFSSSVERTDLPLNLSGTDGQFDIPIKVSSIRAFCIGCSKASATSASPNPGTVNLRVRTNNVTTGDQTFLINPAQGKFWMKTSGDPNPLAFKNVLVPAATVNGVLVPEHIDSDATPVTQIDSFFVESVQPGTPGVAARFNFFIRLLLDSTPNQLD